MQKLGMSLFAAAMMFGALACDDGAADTAQNAGICQRICNAVVECTGDEDSKDECREECVNESEDDGFEERAEECAQCIERENSCTENTIECTPECAGVVALSST